MATGAMLLKQPVPLSRCQRSGRNLGLRLRSILSQAKWRTHQNNPNQQFHPSHDFPFHAGNRNRYTSIVSQIFLFPVEANCRE